MISAKDALTRTVDSQTKMVSEFFEEFGDIISKQIESAARIGKFGTTLDNKQFRPIRYNYQEISIRLAVEFAKFGYSFSFHPDLPNSKTGNFFISWNGSHI